MTLRLEHFGTTHAGKVRRNNEDSFLAADGRDASLFAVADGIGGFEAGEVASLIAVDILKDLAPSGSLEGAIKEANRKILAAARSDEKLSGMGTTVVVARFESDGEEPLAEISHVGDSRAYLLRGGELRPVTEDHSLVAELVRSGDLTRAQASEHPRKNLITRALGADEEVEVDTAVLPVEAGDRLLLCSDGLTDMVAETKIKEILESSSPENSARSLVSAALEAGGADNVTVVVVDAREEVHSEEPHAGRRGDTQEMRPIVLEPGEAPARHQREPSSRRPRTRRERKKKKPSGRDFRARALAAFVRWVAAAVVLAVLAMPFYLWANNQYFLGFDRGEAVIYQGLPYEPLGFTLNKEVRRTNLKESEVPDINRAQFVEHELKDIEEAERVVRDLEQAAEPTTSSGQR